MRSRASRPLVLLLTVVALAACDPGGEPGPGGPSAGPRGADEIVQHLVDPPDYPAPVTADAELAELRSAAGDNRHQAYLAELEESGTLDGELVRGSMVLVAVGTTLSIPDGASTADLEDGTVASVGDCAAPCEVSGPALVAPTGWLSGIGVVAGWELVVPAPEA